MAAGRLYRSDDGGAAWSRIDAGLDDDDLQRPALDPSDPATLYAGG